jgi:hypothetical protein
MLQVHYYLILNQLLFIYLFILAVRLVFGLPQRVIARLPDSLSLSGRTLTQLIPIVWRNYARAGLEPSSSTESGTSASDADTTKPQPLKEVCSLATL